MRLEIRRRIYGPSKTTGTGPCTFLETLTALRLRMRALDVWFSAYLQGFATNGNGGSSSSRTFFPGFLHRRELFGDGIVLVMEQPKNFSNFCF